MRIVYVHLANPEIAGGQKMAVRHVETLNELGFEAVLCVDPGVRLPGWFQHRAPVIVGGPIREDDVVVVPEDGPTALPMIFASRAARVVVLCQNPYYSVGMELVARHAQRVTALLTVSPGQARLMRRLIPQAATETVRCFADERVFGPAPKEPLAVFAPRKRPVEAAAIRRFHRLLRPDQELGWMRVERASETQVAEAFGRAAVYLSLSRLESVGMTTLEAMASGCLCAGFTGIGGDEYATPENGFWAPEDDCVAAAEALGAAIDLYRAGGARLASMVEAGRATAAAWSYAVFRRELEDVWMRLAPEARRA